MFPARKFAQEETISLDIHFQNELTVNNLATLATELVKILIHQRKQIPEQIEVLKRLCSTLKCRQASSDVENISTDVDAKSRRNEIRRKQMEKRRNKLEKRFLDRAAKSIEHFDRLIKNFFDEIVIGQLTGPVEEVAIVFGATPVTAKEIYRIEMPPNLRQATCGQGMNSRAMQQLFRSIVMHEDLFNRLGQPMNVTNVYLALRKRDVSLDYLPPNLIFRPGFLSGPARRCKMTVFNLRPEQQSQAVFQTPMKSDMPPRKVSYTPYPMELCTPLHDQSNVRVFKTDGDGDITPSVFRPSRKFSGVENGIVGHRSLNVDESGTLDENIVMPQVEKLSLDESSNWFFLKEAFKGFKDPRIESA